MKASYKTAFKNVASTVLIVVSFEKNILEMRCTERPDRGHVAKHTLRRTREALFRSQILEASHGHCTYEAR